jgi:hypothetical protein
MEEMNEELLAPIEDVCDEDEVLPTAATEVETVTAPLLFPSQVAAKFPKDRCVAVHSRNIYMSCAASNRWVSDGSLERPVGAQSILRKEAGKFCDAIFHDFPPPEEG